MANARSQTRTTYEPQEPVLSFNAQVQIDTAYMIIVSLVLTQAVLTAGMIYLY